MRPMASIRPSASKWRVQVYVNGTRDSDTFETCKEAAQWALEREAELPRSEGFRSSMGATSRHDGTPG